MIVPETLEKIAGAAASLGELSEHTLACLEKVLAGSAFHYLQRRRYARAVAGCIEARKIQSVSGQRQRALPQPDRRSVAGHRSGVGLCG